jgi:hypothetical protein
MREEEERFEGARKRYLYVCGAAFPRDSAIRR